MMPNPIRALAAITVITGFVVLPGCQSETAPPARSPTPAARNPTPAAVRTATAPANVGAAPGSAPRAVAGRAGNMLENGGFEDWPTGDSAQLPAHWHVVEEEALRQISRATTSDDVHEGRSALRFVAEKRVVSLGNDGATISDTTNTELRGGPVTAGVWAKADEPNAAFIQIRDGVDQSKVVDHPGDGAWHFLTVTYTLDPNATLAKVRIGNRKQDDKTVVIFDGAVLMAGESAGERAGESAGGRARPEGAVATPSAVPPAFASPQPAVSASPRRRRGEAAGAAGGRTRATP
jgi:hypothetical protein